MKIAVIAHDGKKAEMVAFLNRHMDFLKSVGTEIVATGTTGKHAQDAGLEQKYDGCDSSHFPPDGKSRFRNTQHRDNGFLRADFAL